MKKRVKSKTVFILISIIFISGYNLKLINATEPIMDYKFTVEEQKIKRAQFIWTSCMDELRKENVLTEKDIININDYLKNTIKNDKSRGMLKMYESEKKALRISTIDNMIKEKIITENQGKKLKKRLNKYDLTNLEN